MPEADPFVTRQDSLGTPAQRMRVLCGALLRETDSSVPVDVQLLASYRGLHVRTAHQPDAGMLFWDSNRWVIQIRASDEPGRQRFSVCHEICHTMVPGDSHGSIDPTVGTFDSRRGREWLCDLGAGELLMPRGSFLEAIPDQPGIADVIRLAGTFQVSVEALSFRLAQLAPQPLKVIVLERNPHPNGPGWSVARVLGRRGRRVRRGMVLDPNSSLAHLRSGETLEYVGDAGLGIGDLFVSGREEPYAIDGIHVARLLVLVRPG